MRSLIPVLAPLALALAACSGGEGNNSSAAAPPAPTPTGPPPKTPVTKDAPVASGNEAHWMEPRDNGGDPTSAPYGNVLSQPVVNGSGAR